MATYLLNCYCGKTVPVELGQAGGQVGCSCGAQLDVPPLRKLRHLPQTTVEDTRSGGSWGARQGLIAASLIVLTAATAWSVWIWWKEPVVPKFAAAAHAARMNTVEEQLKTPSGGWEAWIAYYRPLAERGFSVFQVANLAQIEAEIAHKRFLRRTLWIVAAIFAVIAAAAAFLPRSRPAR